MSGIEAVGLVLSAIPIAIEASNLLSDYFLGPAREYKASRFGKWAKIFGFADILDLSNAQELHRNINLWNDKDLQAWKASYISSCNAISVAGAIFASIGLTSLQLPNLNMIHWTARAFFSISMLLGIMSVIAATSEHHTIGMINEPTALRLWLSKGATPTDRRTGMPHAYPEPYDKLPLESSISATLLTQFPLRLLKGAAILYIIGFALYLIFSWREAVPDDNNDYRNIFIMFIAIVGLGTIYYSVTYTFRVIDSARIAGQFGTQRLGATFDDSQELQRLQAELKSLHGDNDPTSELRALTKEIIELRKALTSVQAQPHSNRSNGDSPT